MELTPLASTGRKTTRLGYGCAFPAPPFTERDAMRLLDAAFDAGIRHFDVAPMYADGAAETYLGNFLAKHPGEITVTTKYGILPPSLPLRARLARRIIKPVLRTLRRIPMVNRGLSASPMRAVSKAAFSPSEAKKAAFSPNEAKVSLEHSLHQLRLDKVDILLMHEPTVADLEDDRLLQFLKDSVADDRIGSFGVGGSSYRAPELHRNRRQFCDVMQFDWSVFSLETDYQSSFLIHYGVFSLQLQALHKRFTDRSDICRRWSDRVGLDLGDVRTLAAVMLKTALTRRTDSIVLFASKKPESILRNVDIAEDSKLEQNALRFCALVDGEGKTLLAS